jgi:hypothetical protein
MAVEYGYTIAETPASITQIDLTHEAQYSAGVTVTLYAYNVVGTTWDTIGTTQAFTNGVDGTMTRSITTNPSDYIDGSGLLTVVFYPSARATVSVDYAEAAVSYSGFVPGTDDITLNWTASVDGDVDFYNIYRSSTQGGTYSVVGTAPVGTNTFEDDLRGEFDGTDWWYHVTAVDLATNEGTATPNVPEVPVGTPPYAISLTGKAANSWVFVSFPSVLSGAIQTILNDATAGDGGTTWSVAKWYNAATPLDPWKTYRQGALAGTNDLATINNQMGVWLYITANGGDQALTLNTYAANSATPIVISLAAGWNQVGYPSASPSLASATLPAQADIIGYWQAASPYFAQTANLATVTMTAGNAYWVHTTAACDWTVNP